jgi:hypothetical protein
MSGLTRRLPVAVLLAAATAAPAAPPPSALDLVPEDAAFGLAVRSVSDLKKKGDKLYADAGLKEENLPRVSTLFGELYAMIGIKAGVDEDSPASVIVANPKAAGLAKVPYDPDILKLLVGAVPFKDLDTIAGNFNLKADDLKDGRVVKAPTGTFFLRVRGRHLLLGLDEKTLGGAFNGKALAAALPEAQRKSLAGTDILFHVGPEWLGESWGDFVKGVRARLGDDLGEADRKVADDLADALKAVRYFLGAVRVDDGLGVSLVAVLPEKVPEQTRRFLASLAGGAGPSDLRGLPDGPAVFAEASGGGGGQGARVMKLLADFVLREVSQAKWLPSPADRANVLTVFAEVWKRSQGHRVAIYRNADPVKHGLFSAVAILDTADGSKFLADMKQLARLAGTDGLDLSDKGPKDDVAAVEKLIRDLGDDDYDLRESASRRLALVGVPALPLIEKATKAGDAELRRRAEDLKEQIVAAATARRRDLLSKEAPWRIRPTFQFEPKPEQRAGRAIETARVRLLEKDAPAAPALREVFGPGWDRVRLAARGKQVVVLVGSDERLLDAALANLEGGKPGLGAAKSLAAFARQAEAGRRLEFHASVKTVLELLHGDDLRGGKPSESAPVLSSAALDVAPGRLRLDLWLPASELGAILKRPE